MKDVYNKIDDLTLNGGYIELYEYNGKMLFSINSIFQYAGYSESHRNTAKYWRERLKIGSLYPNYIYGIYKPAYLLTFKELLKLRLGCTNMVISINEILAELRKAFTSGVVGDDYHDIDKKQKEKMLKKIRKYIGDDSPLSKHNNKSILAGMKTNHVDINHNGVDVGTVVLDDELFITRGRLIQSTGMTHNQQQYYTSNHMVGVTFDVKYATRIIGYRNNLLYVTVDQVLKLLSDRPKYRENIVGFLNKLLNVLDDDKSYDVHLSDKKRKKLKKKIKKDLK